MKRWLVADPVPEEAKKDFSDLHPVALQLLWNRGIRTRGGADVFLAPDWNRDTYGPELFQNMLVAVFRMFRALEAGERITIHGDYDADGVCGSTVLVSTLRDICRKLGFDEKNISAYIPHREKEGYGMSVSTMELLASEGTKLVVTVDCGISNKPAIDRGLELGIDTIVCDHHAMPDVLPQGAILLHPQVPGETYPNKVLCGTGVAFKFASALVIEARKRGATWPEGQEKWLLDLVAIATVTDVMPLKGENRTLESFGLRVLNKTKRVGLRKLIEIAGGKPGMLDTFSIGFQIGPRLNAAGRMDHASAAMYLLLEEDEAKATELAMKLNETNIERQKASEAMYQEAKQMIGEPTKKVIIVAKEGWPAGLVGLVAGKLVNDFSRPVYVVGRDGEKFTGSGRTYGGFDVTAALHACEGNLDRFGGHPQACGFSVLGEERFQKAVALLEAHAESVIKPESLEPIMRVDAAITLEDADWALIEILEKFEPFGEGNPRPVFVSEKLRVAYCDTLSDGKHIRLTVRSPGGRMAKMIGFRMGERAPFCQPGTVIDAAYELGVNEWKGNREIQLKLVDIRV